MGLFNFGKNKDKQENTPPRNPSTMIFFRLLAVGYVLWIWKDLVKALIEGGPEAPSLTMVIISGVVFIGAGVWIVITSLRDYKRMKAEFDAYNDQVAEEYRLEEEAKARAEEDYEEVEEDYEAYEEETEEEMEE